MPSFTGTMLVRFSGVIYSFLLISGDLPANHEVLREVSSLCDQLPVLDNKVFEKDFCSVSTGTFIFSVHNLLTLA